MIVGESGADTVNAYDADAITASGFVSATRVWGLGMPGSSATAGMIAIISARSNALPALVLCPKMIE